MNRMVITPSGFGLGAGFRTVSTGVNLALTVRRTRPREIDTADELFFRQRFPRKRESRKPQKSLDARFRGHDDLRLNRSFPGEYRSRLRAPPGTTG